VLVLLLGGSVGGLHPSGAIEPAAGRSAGVCTGSSPAAGCPRASVTPTTAPPAAAAIPAPTPTVVPTPVPSAATAPVAPAQTTSTAPATAAALVAPVAHSYPASDAALANPERGWTHYTETRWSPDGLAYTPLDVAQLRGWRELEGVTLVYRVFYLEGLADIDVIDPVFRAQVDADLAAARAAGVKLVVRFAYSPDTDHDAPVDRTIGHVQQLMPLVNAHADVVWVLQAGFIGRWGEWYYSASYTSDPSRPWSLTDADWARRGRVLDALLNATGSDVLVQVRYPAIVQRLLAGDPRADRVGVHDDCFLASATDMGTFATASDTTWLARRSAATPVGGETCAPNAPRSDWLTAARELARYHWSYLNTDFHTGVLQSWGPAGLAEVSRRLGPRLRLVSAVLPASARAGGTARVSITLTNDGWAAPVEQRPVQLVLAGPAGQTTSALSLDVRTLAPGTSRTVTATVRMPAAPGGYTLALALPDPAASLAADPAYAVQLANVGTWDATTGRNDLQQLVAVTP
jgi:hypothetical protein